MKSEGTTCFFDRSIVHPRPVIARRCVVPPVEADDGGSGTPLYIVIARRNGWGIPEGRLFA